MPLIESSTPYWFKRATWIAGAIAVSLGIPFSLNLLCIVPVVLSTNGGLDVIIYGVVSLMAALLTLGVGWSAFWHANRSLQNKPSKPLRLPTPMLLAGIFTILIVLGLAFRPSDNGAGFLLVPILVAGSLLPPLWSLAWMIPPAPSRQVDGSAGDVSGDAEAQVHVPTQPSLSWRWGLLSFAGGATVSVFIAIVLEVLLPVIILSLVFNLTDIVTNDVRALFRALSNERVATALTSPGFIFVFVQIAIIAPLAEEFAKPLITLPLLRNLDRPQAFWIGALAGAGFAALENVIYATSGLSIWAGILIVRALGGALHPLGSGLVAQGWRDVLRAEKDAGKNWWKRYGIAVVIHAAWNGGSLLVITLGGARFFGELPPEVNLLGLSAAVTTLAFLIVLGLSALWIGRAYGYNRPIILMEKEAMPEVSSIPSDRALALWAVACLIALVPAGIAGLKLWLR